MVIDLGLARGPSPERAARGWRPDRARTRPVALLATLVLVLGLAGAVPPSGPSLTEVAFHRVKARDLLLAGDRLLVTSAAERGAATTWQLSAYDTSSGDHLWTVPYDAASWRLRQVRRAGKVILVDPRSGPGTGATVVLDADTGRVRWVAPTGLTVTTDGATALITEPAEPAESTGSTESTGSGRAGPAELILRARDLATGDELWRSELSASTEVLAGAPAEVVLVGTDGRAQVRDARNGRVVRVDDLGAVSAPMAMAGTLVLRQWRADGLGVTGYDPSTLRRRWSRPIWYGPGRITQCGGLICFPAGSDIEAVDPLSGDLVWRIRADLVVDYDGYLVAFTVTGDDGGAASAESAALADAGSGASSGTASGSGRIVDPVTGRTLLPLSAWDTELEGRGDATFVGYRQPTEQSPTWLAVLAPASRADPAGRQRRRTGLRVRR
ncbi:PQQ-binding-like beta-propeller repeat protein [Solwaraspora sp. WMMD406]|uniref:outer membrane protein assembly factor BamB family protein n=1 Tax=Solwaraspora sp. WMMD406 TaxID=3016095 RepID=UPI002416E421|nr:PQQ-binding-like beta-propeller repeat protein [Solwaraspora sp. WMMD406]MDG4764131.1 PQQ-binding-like beta-propeller repeat protein [Solwaraspora sp. WMMD406]